MAIIVGRKASQIPIDGVIQLGFSDNVVELDGATFLKTGVLETDPLVYPDAEKGGGVGFYTGISWQANLNGTNQAYDLTWNPELSQMIVMSSNNNGYFRHHTLAGEYVTESAPAATGDNVNGVAYYQTASNDGAAEYFTTEPNNDYIQKHSILPVSYSTSRDNQTSIYSSAIYGIAGACIYNGMLYAIDRNTSQVRRFPTAYPYDPDGFVISAVNELGTGTDGVCSSPTHFWCTRNGLIAQYTRAGAHTGVTIDISSSPLGTTGRYIEYAEGRLWVVNSTGLVCAFDITGATGVMENKVNPETNLNYYVRVK